MHVGVVEGVGHPHDHVEIVGEVSLDSVIPLFTMSVNAATHSVAFLMAGP